MDNRKLRNRIRRVLIGSIAPQLLDATVDCIMDIIEDVIEGAYDKGYDEGYNDRAEEQ